MRFTADSPIIRRVSRVPRVTFFLVPFLLVLGCGDKTDPVRAIQAKRQDRLQSQSTVDHLGKTFDLLSRLVELNPKESRRQITYHLNQWRQGRIGSADTAIMDSPVTPLIKTFDDLLPSNSKDDRAGRKTFVAGDVDHLRDSYLCRQITRWVDTPQHDDPMLQDWMDSLEEKVGEDVAGKLRTASRLFDWTVRNIAIEPLADTTRGPPPPPMSNGLEFRGGCLSSN